jgi:adhesin transport system outer membrane protein
MKTNKFAKLNAFALFFAVSFPALAQTSLPATLKEVAQQAVLNSP